MVSIHHDNNRITFFSYKSNGKNQFHVLMVNGNSHLVI